MRQNHYIPKDMDEAEPGTKIVEIRTLGGE